MGHQRMRDYTAKRRTWVVSYGTKRFDVENEIEQKVEIPGSALRIQNLQGFASYPWWPHIGIFRGPPVTISS